MKLRDAAFAAICVMAAICWWAAIAWAAFAALPAIAALAAVAFAAAATFAAVCLAKSAGRCSRFEEETYARLLAQPGPAAHEGPAPQEGRPLPNGGQVGYNPDGPKTDDGSESCRRPLGERERERVNRRFAPTGAAEGRRS